MNDDKNEELELLKLKKSIFIVDNSESLNDSTCFDLISSVDENNAKQVLFDYYNNQRISKRIKISCNYNNNNKQQI